MKDAKEEHMKEANYIDPNSKYSCLGEIRHLKFNEGFLREAIGSENIRSVLKDAKDVVNSDGYVIYAPVYLPHISSEGIIGLPEYREDVVWLIFDALPELINEEFLAEVKQKYLSKWNTLSQALSDAHISINVISSGCLEWDAAGARGETATDFSFLNLSKCGTWTYELKNGEEEVSFINKNPAPGNIVPLVRNKAAAKTKGSISGEICRFCSENQVIQIDRQYFEEALKERSLKTEDFSVLQAENDSDFVIRKTVPRSGSFSLNGRMVTVDILGGSEKYWDLWNKEMFLVLSMSADYSMYPFPGANSHARDMKYSMRLSQIPFFVFLSARCDVMFAARSLVNYLVFLETMAKNGFQPLTQFLSSNVATKKNGALCKARICTIEPKEVFPGATDTFRIAFKCRNIAEDSIEVELLCNYCTGKESYEYDDNCLIMCEFEQFKKYYNSANF